MRIETSELNGAALDWAVATCEGYTCQFDDETSGPWLVPQEGYLHDERPLSAFKPSTKWAQGGPITEREGITVGPHRGSIGAYVAWKSAGIGHHRNEFSQHGPTPLIAAMRCYVASKLGDEVDVPDALVV